MPVYHFCCSDQIRHDCEEEVRVRLDIVGLTHAQIEAIEQGMPIELSAEQVAASDLQLDETQQASLREEGFVRYRIDIQSICDACGNVD